jgi:ATP-binding cassette subfamily B protein
MNESITSFETIKGLSIEKKIIKKYKENNVLLLNKLKKLENLYNFEYFLKEAISSVGQVVILFIGSILIINNSLTLGKLISFLFLYSFFLEPIKNIIDLNKEIKEALSALNRINDLIYEEKDIIDTYNKINNIEIKNLSYTHDDINKTLNNVNLKINKGEKIMMIGSSGSGKSTLLKILKRYYKVDNEKIFFDNKDINKYSLKTINKNITYISQNEILYTDTIYNNLNLDRNININDIEQIIKLCYLDNILDNNLKLNTLVEENGFNLSGGERQRLILARGILNNFEILILDESLSQVDINLERKILKNILNKFKDKTIIFVSHRYNNIDLFDRVINIEKGKIKNIEKNRTSYLPREELYD